LVSSADEFDALRRRPTRLSTLVFHAKATALRARRRLRDLTAGVPRHRRSDIAAYPAIMVESRTPLWSDDRPEERWYQLGKVENLRRAARSLDGVAVPAGAIFSFWRQIGRASRGRGYVVGRMLQQGCLVPAMGGGLCQLSNALYELALRSGCAVIERHAHSRRVPGSAAAAGRDATVAWNYIDLRFRAARPLLIEARLERDALVIRFRGGPGATADNAPEAVEPEAPVLPRLAASSCASCGDRDCFRHEATTAAAIGHAAYLLDEAWPEFRDYVRRAHRAEDVLGIPLDGARWRLARYRWETAGFARVRTAPLETLSRALTARRLQAQGPARLLAQLAAAERLARRLGRLLAPEATQLCVAQSLLPFLWREGNMGGRGFRVLMTRLPMRELEARLDVAWAAHPERASLHDFRAPAALVEAETAALAAADLIVTPHAEIARLFPGRALLLPWQMQSPPVAPAGSASSSRRVVFPGPTIARKGAFELRAAAQALDLEIVPLGRTLEEADFWHGVRLGTPPAEPRRWLDSVAAVVQPAFVEEQPRRLLAALAAGVPVIATPACGIAPCAGLTLVEPGDGDGLVAALRQVLDPG
jgi:hypothetical protein